MPPLAYRIRLLAREPAEAAATVLAAALARAEPHERQPLADAAIATRRPAGVAAVLGRLHDLSPATLAALGRAEPRLLAAAMEAVRRRRDARAAVNAVAVIRRHGTARLLGPLLGFLELDDPELTARCGETLLDLVVALAGVDGRRPLAPGTRQRLDAAVAGALEGSSSRGLGDVHRAAAILGNRPGPELARILDDADHPALFALRRVVARTESPHVRANFLRWLDHPVLGPQTLRWLHQAVSGRPAEVLGRGHLLAAPARRRALRRVDRPGRCLPDLATASTLGDDAQRGLVRLIRALPLSGSVRRDRLADCLALPSGAARLLAAIDLAGRADDADLERLCFDRDPAVAWLAADRLPPDRLRHVAASPHPEVTRRAVAADTRESVDAFFEHWLSLPPHERLAAARWLVTERRRDLLAGLERVLAEGARPARLAGTALTARLGLADDLEGALAALTRDGDTHVASAAVLALAGARGGLPVLRDAVGHADPRVRANAVEALSRRDRRVAARLGEGLADSRDSRLRANAVVALVRAPDPTGPPRLRAMLADADARHRVSGLWAARRTAEAGVLREVRRLARRDRLAEVRTRAAATARWMTRRAPRHLARAG